MRARTIGAILGATAVVVGAMAVIDTTDSAPALPAPIVAPAVTYGPAITISQGGTYSPTSSGVTIATTQPVVLDGCAVKSSTRSLVTVGAGANVTIRNCYFEGSTSPNTAGYRAVSANAPASLTVENNDFVHIAPVKVQGGTPTVSIVRNRVRDIIGDETNCCGGGYAPAFQLSNLTTPSTEIAWNEVVNLPGQSNMEDAVNLFGASGTVASPILVHDNFVWGAYPLPITDRYSGGGILTGDGGGGTNNVTVVDNQLVGTTNYGVQIGGGNNVRFERNRVVSSGLTADGTAIKAQNVGGTFWTYQTAPTNSSMSNNVFGFMRPPGSYLEPNNATWHRVDSWMPACGTGGNTCTGNQSLTASGSTRITYDAEVAEWARWVAKAAGQQIGRKGPPATTTTTASTTTTTVPATTTTTTAPPTTTSTAAPTTTTTTRPCVDIPSLAVRVCPL